MTELIRRIDFHVLFLYGKDYSLFVVVVVVVVMNLLNIL